MAAVALANKNARIVWALLAHDREFRPDYAPATRGRVVRPADRSNSDSDRRSHHRLLRRSCSDGKTGQTVVGKARYAPEHLECDDSD